MSSPIRSTGPLAHFPPDVRFATAHARRLGMPRLNRVILDAFRAGEIDGYLQPGGTWPKFRDTDVDDLVARLSRRVRMAGRAHDVKAERLAAKMRGGAK